MSIYTESDGELRSAAADTRGTAMTTPIISIDGHVKAPRAVYRDYLDPQYRDAYDEVLRAAEGQPDGFVHPALDPSVQWDGPGRLAALEPEGVVAEVLIPNGTPFPEGNADVVPDSELARAGCRAYNRWLVDFCATAPGRFSGQAQVSFDDVALAVADIHEIADQGLGGILMPPLHPESHYFFQPELDPIWAAVEEVGLPLTQHGGTGAPTYKGTDGFASLMVRAAEHSFFSGRSLWQMILGGVFDRFPGLRLVFVETEAWWVAPMIHQLDRRATAGDDWSEFAELINLHKTHERLPSEYWASNCYAGVSPFTPEQVDLTAQGDGFSIGPANAMVGLDFPHPEGIYGSTAAKLAPLRDDGGLSSTDLDLLLFSNAADVYGFDRAALTEPAERLGLVVPG